VLETKPVARSQNRTSNISGSSAPTGPSNKSKAQLPEFNFAQNNAKFSKEEVAKEAAAGEKSSVIPESDTQEGFYNKSSSFFDNISSSAKERFEGGDANMTRYERRGEERKLNLETFGQAGSDNRNNRGRGRGGRGRGRGGRGGRGGFNRGSQGSQQFDQQTG